MFRERTVFVIGAGASVEVGLPDGRELARRISRSLNFEFRGLSRPEPGADFAMFHHIELLAASTNGDINKYLAEARLVSSGIQLAGSIDEYLYRHADRALHAPLGKLAIFHHLVKAERESKIFISDHAKASDVVQSAKETWFHEFANQLCAGRSAAQLEKLFDGVSIISFNYDRCLKRYLAAFVEQAYHLTPAASTSVVEQMVIYYPFGSIGSLLEGQSSSLPFGAQTDQLSLVDRLNSIRTYTETFEQDEKLLGSVREEIKEANCLVFLGFGFHKPNIDLLKPLTMETRNKKMQIVATAFDLSEPNVIAVKSMLNRMVGMAEPEVLVERELKAFQLMRDYNIVLAG